MKEGRLELTEEDALRAYARMINTLDAAHLEPLLAVDFRYSSQAVFKEMTSKEEFMEYITGKLKTFGSIPERTRAEMGVLGKDLKGGSGLEMLVLSYAYEGRPCVLVSQGDENNPQATVFAKVKEGMLKRLDICVMPPPSAAIRSGDFPE